MPVELRAVGWAWIGDDEADVSYLDQEGSEARRAAYRRGEFGHQGCYAVAELVVEGVVQTIHSGGLYGIESDSDDAYRAEVEAEQLTELRAILAALGVQQEVA